MSEGIPAPQEPARRYVPDRTLPPYRYVPGLNPHPFRNPAGHMYTDGSAPDEPDWDSNQNALTDSSFLWGVDLFNHRYFWESHEAWEALWHQVDRTDPRSDLLQGLIQAGAFVLQRHRGKQGPSDRLFNASMTRLKNAHNAAGDICYGVELPATMTQLSTFHDGGEWPVIVLQRR